MTGTLFLVGTPIGNLGDITERARRTLRDVDLVAAEDTRHTGRLLKSLGITARLVSLFEGNEAERVPEIVSGIREGADVAVVSDAGMPGISDPGYRLVTACVDAGVPVDVVPGPSSAIAALVVSGLPTDRFAFEGFLPRSGRERADRLAAIAGEPRTVVLFEAPRRVARTLGDLLDSCGDRRAAVCRELTKLHQEILRGRLSEVAARIGGRELKGELVVVLEGRRQAAGVRNEREAVGLATELVVRGARKREAARRASGATGVPARKIYEALVGGHGSEGAPGPAIHGAAGSSTGAGGRRAESSE